MNIKLDDLINKITCADCMDILPQLPDKCVDLVCTDCPYKIISGGCTTGLYGNDKKDIPVGCGKCAKKWETAGQLNKNYKNIKSGKMFEQNDIVLDPFSGSGSVACACHNLKRRFICIEKDPEYWKASCERLEQAQRQQTLF